MIESQPAGARLRAIREELGLSVRDIAQRTRIDDRFLRTIEEADYRPFTAALFAVGFARSYARALGEPTEAVADEARAGFLSCAA